MNKYTTTQGNCRSTRLWALALVVVSAFLFLAACTHEPEVAEATAKYTEQTARAIIEGSWKIAGAIVFAAFIRGMLNK